MSTQPRVDLLAGVGPTTFTQRWEVDGTVADVGAVTYQVLDANGDEVAAGTASKTGTGTETAYTFQLPIQANPTRLKITWTRSDSTAKLTHYVEVFGSQLFTEADARGSTISGFQTPFADTTKYPDELLAAWRLRIQDQFESKTSRSWVRRYARVRFAANRSYRLRPFELAKAVDWEGRPLAGAGRFTDIVRVISVTDLGEPVDLANVVLDGETLHLTEGYWHAPTLAMPLNVVVEYEYGVDPPDPEARGHALAMLHSRAVPSDISSHVESWSDDAGSFRVGPEGWAYPSHVWEWLERVRYRVLIA